MTHGQFIIGLTLIAMAVVVLLYFGIRMAVRSPDRDAIEHDDGEP